MIRATAHTHFGHHRRSLNPQGAFWTALNGISESNTINSNKRIRLCFLREVPPHWDNAAASSVLLPPLLMVPSLGRRNERLSFDMVSGGVCLTTTSRGEWKPEKLQELDANGRSGCRITQPKNSIWWLTISFDLFLGVSRSWMISSYKRAHINSPPHAYLLRLCAAAYWSAIGWLLLKSPSSLHQEQFQPNKAFLCVITCTDIWSFLRFWFIIYISDGIGSTFC